MASASERVPLKRITTKWSSYRVCLCSEQSFTAWSDAEAALWTTARMIPPREPLRVYFEVVWQNEQRHKGRIDLSRLVALRSRTPLADQVQESLSFFAGRGRPPHWTAAQYEEAFAEHLTHNPNDDVRCAYVLDHCDLGGSDAP